VGDQHDVFVDAAEVIAGVVTDKYMADE